MEKRNVNTERRFASYALLSIVTLGIYKIMFWWKLIEDLNAVCGPTDKEENENSYNYLVVILLTLVTCGVYGLYWWYKQGKRMKRAGRAYGLSLEEDGINYLQLSFFTLVPITVISTILVIIGSMIFAVFALFQASSYEVWDLFSGDLENKVKGSIAATVTLYLILLIIGGLILNLARWGISQYYFIKNMNRLCKAYARGEASGQKNQDSQETLARSIAPDDSSTLAFTAGQIVGISGDYQGMTINLSNGDKILFGREGSCNVVIQDTEVSRKHCMVRYSELERAYFVTDYSTNGVFMENGQRITKMTETKVAPGGRIRLGQSQQVFLLK